MKLDNLRQLIKEELAKATEAAKPGTYKVFCKYKDNDGISQDDFTIEVPEGNEKTLFQVVRDVLTKENKTLLQIKD